MFIRKKKYFIIIENIKDIKLSNLKKNKFSLIYRPKKNITKFNKLLSFRKKCLTKNIKFYVANDFKLCKLLKSDGIYLSSFNKNLKVMLFKRSNFDLIGSAHNIKELNLKKLQRCSYILFSKLFRVSYKPNDKFFGLLRFNLLMKKNSKIIPLGGINLKNLKKLNQISSEGLALMSEIKKKPAISSRLL
tara:strand:- start:1942 stop:2508 length:567 start_codon:yes stop_codon:yes gene_type:complete